MASNSEGLATGHRAKSICSDQSVQCVGLSCVSPADRLFEHHGGTRAHLQDLLPQEEGLSKPVGWQLLDADSFTPLAQVYPAGVPSLDAADGPAEQYEAARIQWDMCAMTYS